MRVAFIGAGAMASAIAKGAHAGDPGGWTFVFRDPWEDAAENLATQVSGVVAPTIEEAVADAEMIVLAVKPQVQTRVLAELPATDAVIVSIAAGRTLDQISKDLAGTPNTQPALVRVMPNVNALVGKATSAICANEHAAQDQVAAVRKLFDSVGVTMEVPEDLFAPFTAMAGSSPAWFFAIINHLATGGVKHGLAKAEAMRAAVETMAGSAALLAQALDEGDNATTLIDRVCSPGGTTVAGLLAAEGAGLGPSLIAAVDATIKRDRELGA